MSKGQLLELEGAEQDEVSEMKARVETVEVTYQKKLPTGKYQMEHIGVALKGTVVCETEDELKESAYDLFVQARKLVDAQVWTTKQINDIE